ncbi:MAG: transketolase C-terminal domain-containing protein [Clostridia bacterium]|nr:transketolase C-terminal domain-containing protein [Clostridia bacterium]
MSEKKATRVGYGEALASLGDENQRIVVLDADLSCSTMTQYFAKAHPDRFFDCGIAEANMVTMAAGLASVGNIPFCSTFAVFASRCFEQIRNGVCHPHLNVKFAFTHAGITVGEDGATHQAIEDIAIMRTLPGMTILAPCDAEEAKRAVYAAAEMDGPVYLRLARLATPVFSEGMPFEIGKANVLREGGDAALITCGLMVEACMKAAGLLAEQGIEVTVVNMHTIKPLDEDIVRRLAKEMKLFTVEEHSTIGGLGDAVAAVVAEHGGQLKKIGIEDRFGQSGTPAELLDYYGLSPEKIAGAVASRLR